MTPSQVENLVSSAQRRTASRTEAHFLLCREVEAMALGPMCELVLRDAVYRRLFPEHAHRLGDAHCVGANPERRRPHRHPGERRVESGVQHA